MSFTTHATTSADGTVIGYRQTGHGPGLILCHGGGRISQHYEKLAQALSDTFTVYIPDRRGRGLSGPEGKDYGIQKAVEDLEAVIRQTGAALIFGHSAGAMIALETMLHHPVKKLAVYEPPVSVNHSFPFGWISDFENALHAGQRKKAVAISLKGLNVVEGIGKLPLRAIMLLINVLSLFERRQKGTRMADLIPTLEADIKMAKELDSTYERYQQITIPVALMAGFKSPDYFHAGIKVLEDVLPQAEMKVFVGLEHYSPEEKVTEIATYLKRFYNNR